MPRMQPFEIRCRPAICLDFCRGVIFAPIGVWKFFFHQALGIYKIRLEALLLLQSFLTWFKTCVADNSENKF